ncbi:unnamed protein product, partial [Ranitomeya imitator]
MCPAWMMSDSKCKIPFPSGVTINWLEPKSLLPEPLENGAAPCFPVEESKEQDLLIDADGEPESSQLCREPVAINPEEEEEDSCELPEDDLGAVEEQRSVILHLLSQLKLGMDLTRVVLPTFILEKRSLLEMYADFLSHPDLFLAISGGLTPEARMLLFVEYYLTSFHEGRKGALAKKPYNPIIGETFHCSWRVPKESMLVPQTSETPEDEQDPRPEDATASQNYYSVRFVAEQVSHHPPVSGFYAECPERKMCVNAHVWTKSKFMGMSIGVTMVGEVSLNVTVPLVCFSRSTIMGKTADLTNVQKASLTHSTRRGSHKRSSVKKPLFRVLYPRILMEGGVEGKSVVEKGAQATGITAAWKGLLTKGHSVMWRRFTRSGLLLESLLHHTQTSPGHGLQVSHSLCPATHDQETRSEASYLGQGGKEPDCCQGSKVPESGGRVERPQSELLEV